MILDFFLAQNNLERKQYRYQVIQGHCVIFTYFPSLRSNLFAAFAKFYFQTPYCCICFHNPRIITVRSIHVNKYFRICIRVYCLCLVFFMFTYVSVVMCMYLCISEYTHTHTHAYVHTHIHTYTHTHTYVHTYTHIHTYTHTHTISFLFFSIFISLFKFACINVHMFSSIFIPGGCGGCDTIYSNQCNR